MLHNCHSQVDSLYSLQTLTYSYQCSHHLIPNRLVPSKITLMSIIPKFKSKTITFTSVYKKQKHKKQAMQWLMPWLNQILVENWWKKQWCSLCLFITKFTCQNIMAKKGGILSFMRTFQIWFTYVVLPCSCFATTFNKLYITISSGICQIRRCKVRYN